MLNRLLLALDVLLVIAVGALGVHLYRVWAAAPSPANAAPAAPAAPAAVVAAGPPGPGPTASLATFGVVAERNLFSPTRNEAAPEPPKTGTTAAPAVPKPRLYGVVMGRDGGPRAFLEDPRTRKVFGYGVGDTVAESQIEQIRADRVVLRRGSEVFEILLRDPTKPKPAPVPPPGVPPVGVPPLGVPPGGVPPAIPGAPGPRQVPIPALPFMPTPVPGGPGGPGTFVPGSPGASGGPEIPQAAAPEQTYDPSVQAVTPPGFPFAPAQPAGPPLPMLPQSPAVRPSFPIPQRAPRTVPAPPIYPFQQSPGTGGS